MPSPEGISSELSPAEVLAAVSRLVADRWYAFDPPAEAVDVSGTAVRLAHGRFHCLSRERDEGFFDRPGQIVRVSYRELTRAVPADPPTEPGLPAGLRL